MVQKPWFKVFIWFLATFFFFLASGVIISLLKPGPTEREVMSYMSGMMGAMENSIMGVLMDIEGNSSLNTILIWTITSFPLIIIFSIIAGFYLRKRNGEKRNV
jgi:predicted permease